MVGHIYNEIIGSSYTITFKLSSEKGLSVHLSGHLMCSLCSVELSLVTGRTIWWSDKDTAEQKH